MVPRMVAVQGSARTWCTALLTTVASPAGNSLPIHAVHNSFPWFAWHPIVGCVPHLQEQEPLLESQWRSVPAGLGFLQLPAGSVMLTPLASRLPKIMMELMREMGGSESEWFVIGASKEVHPRQVHARILKKGHTAPSYGLHPGAGYPPALCLLFYCHLLKQISRL